MCHCIKLKNAKNGYNTTPTHTQDKAVRLTTSSYNNDHKLALHDLQSRKARRRDTKPQDRFTANGKHQHSTTKSEVARTNAPQLIRLEDRRGNGRVQPNLGGVDYRALTVMSIAPQGLPPGVEANTGNASPLNATISKFDAGQPRQCLQEGNDVVVPPLPDPAKLDQGFSPKPRGRNGQAHDHASKEEAAPVGVAVVNI
jgi:hypothetical protein